MIVFDTETTGLLKPEPTDIAFQPYMVEFYGIKLDTDFNYISDFSRLIKPPIPMPDDVSRIHGITDEMVVDCQSFIEIYKDLSNFFLGEKTLVAHNAPFDVGVLYYELLRYNKAYNFPWPMRHLCTVEASLHLENKRLKLRDLHEYATGRKHEEGAHRAKEDVMALVRCLEWLVKEGHIDL